MKMKKNYTDNLIIALFEIESDLIIRYFEGGQGGTDPPPGDRCLGLVPPLRPTEIWKFFEINT